MSPIVSSLSLVQLHQWRITLTPQETQSTPDGFTEPNEVYSRLGVCRAWDYGDWIGLDYYGNTSPLTTTDLIEVSRIAAAKGCTVIETEEGHIAFGKGGN